MFACDVPDNIYRFRRLRWGQPDKPWLRRGSPLPQTDAPRRIKALPLLAGAVLIVALVLLVSGG